MNILIHTSSSCSDHFPWWFQICYYSNPVKKRDVFTGKICTPLSYTHCTTQKDTILKAFIDIVSMNNDTDRLVNHNIAIPTLIWNQFAHITVCHAVSTHLNKIRRYPPISQYPHKSVLRVC